MRIAVDWLLRSDIGEVLKEIVDQEEHFPDYRIAKKTMDRKKRGGMKIDLRNFAGRGAHAAQVTAPPGNITLSRASESTPKEKPMGS